MEKHILAYLLLLITHAVHIVVKFFGGIVFILDLYGSLESFLLISITLWVISFLMLFALLKMKPYVHTFSILYGTVMMLEGLSYFVELFLRGSGAVSYLGIMTYALLLAFGLSLIIATHFQQHSMEKSNS